MNHIHLKPTHINTYCNHGMHTGHTYTVILACTTHPTLTPSLLTLSHLTPSPLIPPPSYPHPSSLTPHLSPLIRHPSPLTPHLSPLIPHPSSLTPHPSHPHPPPLTPHPSPLTPQNGQEYRNGLVYTLSCVFSDGRCRGRGRRVCGRGGCNRGCGRGVTCMLLCVALLLHRHS